MKRKQLKTKKKSFDPKTAALVLTCKDLADECHNCTNAISLIEIALNSCIEDDKYKQLNQILRTYWKMRIDMIKIIKTFADYMPELDDNEDVQRFIRHNEMCFNLL